MSGAVMDLLAIVLSGVAGAPIVFGMIAMMDRRTDRRIAESRSRRAEMSLLDALLPEDRTWLWQHGWNRRWVDGTWRL